MRALGTAVSSGPVPKEEEAYDPKILEHIISDTYPTESDLDFEIEALLYFKNMELRF